MVKNPGLTWSIWTSTGYSHKPVVPNLFGTGDQFCGRQFFHGDLSNPGIEPMSPALQADSLPLGHQGSPINPILKRRKLRHRKVRWWSPPGHLRRAKVGGRIPCKAAVLSTDHQSSHYLVLPAWRLWLPRAQPSNEVPFQRHLSSRLPGCPSCIFIYPANNRKKLVGDIQSPCFTQDKTEVKSMKCSTNPYTLSGTNDFTDFNHNMKAFWSLSIWVFESCASLPHKRPLAYPESLPVQSRSSDSQPRVFSPTHAHKNYIQVAYNSLEFLNANQVSAAHWQ